MPRFERKKYDGVATTINERGLHDGETLTDLPFDPEMVNHTMSSHSVESMLFYHEGDGGRVRDPDSGQGTSLLRGQNRDLVCDFARGG